jgi:hypothetical protein
MKSQTNAADLRNYVEARAALLKAISLVSARLAEKYENLNIKNGGGHIDPGSNEITRK